MYLEVKLTKTAYVQCTVNGIRDDVNNVAVWAPTSLPWAHSYILQNDTRQRRKRLQVRLCTEKKETFTSQTLYRKELRKNEQIRQLWRSFVQAFLLAMIDDEAKQTNIFYYNYIFITTSNFSMLRLKSAYVNTTGHRGLGIRHKIASCLECVPQGTNQQKLGGTTILLGVWSGWLRASR